MSVRTVMLLLGALGTAGGTAILAKNWLANERAQILSSVPAKTETKVEVAMQEILLVKKDLVPGTFLTKEHMSWQPWPKTAVGDLMLKKGNVGIDDFVGSVIRSPIAAGQPFSPSAVVQAGEQGFLAAILSPGMRAITVPIDASSGVGGFVFPGDMVDLLVTITMKSTDEEEKANRHFTQTLLSDVRVLAKDQISEQAKGDVKLAKTVTLEVTPKEAEMIALSNKIGKMSLSLRGLSEEAAINEVIAPNDEGQKSNYQPAMMLVDQPVEKPHTDQQRLPAQAPAYSVTTDYDINYFYRRMGLSGPPKHQPDTPTQRPGRSVEVMRGWQSETQKF